MMEVQYRTHHKNVIMMAEGTHNKIPYLKKVIFKGNLLKKDRKSFDKYKVGDDFEIQFFLLKNGDFKKAGFARQVVVKTERNFPKSEDYCTSVFDFSKATTFNFMDEEIFIDEDKLIYVNAFKSTMKQEEAIFELLPKKYQKEILKHNDPFEDEE